MVKGNRFYLIIFSLLLLSFSGANDTELVATIEDADGDGLPDSYEIENNNDPYDRNDTITDADGDGLTLLEEFLYGTSDQHRDSDFDTLPDDWELDNGRNPLLADYQISTGYQSSCAITDEGVVCWGSDNGTLDVPHLSSPTKVAVGTGYACALEDSGEVCWGTNPESLFSVETEPNCVLANETVSCNGLNPPALTNPSRLDSNEDSACAIDDSGIVCWGDVAFGSPPLIENAVQVSVGTSSACALALDGVTCWGYNYYGENEVPMLMIDPDGDGYSNQDGVDAYPLDPTRWLLDETEIEVILNEVTSLTFTYANSTTPIAGVKVIMTESDGTVTILATDSNGQITLPTTTNTYTLTASLSETGDDPITLIDAIHILQYGGELRTLTADQKTAADVNADGEVDILDAIWILQHLGELRTLDKNLIFLDAATGNPLSETTFSATATPNISVIRKGDVDGDFDPSSITNHAPILTGNIPESFSIFENSSIVYDFDATDLEGDSIYFIISGLDSSLFKINSSGVLSFINAPDYENPQDVDKNNIYDVGVSVTDTNPTAKNSMVSALGFVTTNSVYDSSVRVKNFDEDVISLTMTGEDGTSTSPPKIIISLVVDSYTNPTSIAILYENLASSSQYWTNAGATTEENFQMTYESSFTAPENAPTGQWKIRTIRVNTADGLIDHLETYLNNKGFTTRATLYNPNSDTNKPILNSVSSVEVNGNDSDPNTNIVVKFEITAEDTENGYQKAHSGWESPASEGGHALARGWGITNLSISPPKTTFTANLDPKTVSGLYKIEDIRLYDKAGNRHMYYCLEREGEYRLLSEDDTSVDGTNYGGCTVNIDNPIQDSSKPVLTNFSITALVDESNGRKKIGHSIEIDNKTSWTDQETGLRRMYLRILGPNGFRRDIYDGDLGFSGETLLPLDADSGEYYVSYFFVTDLALNDNKYYKTELDDLGFTTSITFD